MLDRLTPAQVAQIERRLRTRTASSSAITCAAANASGAASAPSSSSDRLEDWVGKLSQAQMERVREYAERMPLIDELRDRDRKRLQARSARASSARARRASACPS